MCLSDVCKDFLFRHPCVIYDQRGFVFFCNPRFASSSLSSHWLTRVLLPSGHTPHGDGLTWDFLLVKKDLMPVWQTLLRHICYLVSAVFDDSSPLWLKGSKHGGSILKNGVMSTSNTSNTCCCGIAHGSTVYIFGWFCLLLGFTLYHKRVLLDSELMMGLIFFYNPRELTDILLDWSTF